MDSAYEKFNKKEKVDLERIMISTNHMDNLIDDLLKLSKISQQELFNENCNLSEMVREICENLKHLSPDKDV
jgi:signal transduction histidine kinase